MSRRRALITSLTALSLASCTTTIPRVPDRAGWDPTYAHAIFDDGNLPKAWSVHVESLLHWRAREDPYWSLTARLLRHAPAAADHVVVVERVSASTTYWYALFLLDGDRATWHAAPQPRDIDVPLNGRRTEGVLSKRQLATLREALSNPGLPTVDGHLFLDFALDGHAPWFVHVYARAMNRTTTFCLDGELFFEPDMLDAAKPLSAARTADTVTPRPGLTLPDPDKLTSNEGDPARARDYYDDSRPARQTLYALLRALR